MEIFTVKSVMITKLVGVLMIGVDDITSCVSEVYLSNYSGSSTVSYCINCHFN